MTTVSDIAVGSIAGSATVDADCPSIRSVVDPGALVTNRVRLSEVSDRLAAMTEYDTQGIEIVTEF